MRGTFLEQIKKYENDTKFCYINNIYKDENLTYKKLLDYSDRLAYYLEKKLENDKGPIVVYGHKHPFMVVYFLACVKSGRAFCPVDINTPQERVEEIIRTVESKIVLITEELNVKSEIIDIKKAKEIITTTEKRIDEKHYVKDEDLYYIIFTSGSTGKPKGVCITYNNLNNFLDWYTEYYKEKDNLVFLGHPPFSFDLSVMSLWPSIYMKSTLIQIDKRHQENFKDMFSELEKSNANIWISTPSFIEMCFIDENFNQNLLPHVEQFVFCGEKLFSTTVEKIHERFPKAQVINTYGPTESTVMVTWIEITKEINERYSTNLPVGVVKKGSKIELKDKDEDGKGEIVIIGDTVAKGYFKNDKITKESFDTDFVNNIKYRSYRTGDLGYYKDSMLFCEGRMDFQIKLHGHRIELEDIDSNLLKNEKIRQAATVPNYQDGRVKYLVSFVVYNKKIEKRFDEIKEIKRKLKNLIPEYMIPKKIVFLEEMPLNNNGKIDKKKLKGM
ncbi:D-alanine--poly(phosphoribitol) ligase subunit DltA [Gemella cuniculi]|uniref:D-alanine--poly(phosphoribitol) ligase subunit DltA n=1 Tax=Gemella cuniculi TaxID=150240 RepID=UPI00042104E6|nr:D-alanine--poly(phosphoribitol) ligase subunit DltA [Gemella cuniculi]